MNKTVYYLYNKLTGEKFDDEYNSMEEAYDARRKFFSDKKNEQGVYNIQIGYKTIGTLDMVEDNTDFEKFVDGMIKHNASYIRKAVKFVYKDGYEKGAADMQKLCAELYTISEEERNVIIGSETDWMVYNPVKALKLVKEWKKSHKK